MFNKYLIGGVAVLVLILSGTIYFLYKDNQSKVSDIATLKEEQARLTLVIENKNTQLDLQKKTMIIQENALKENRLKEEETREKLKAIEDSLAAEPGYNDDAAPSLKKLFESLEGKK